MEKLITLICLFATCHLPQSFNPSGHNNKCRLDSGMEIMKIYHYYDESCSFDSSFTKALKPINQFPQTGFPFLKTEKLIKDLTDFKTKEIHKCFSCQLRHQSDFEKIVLKLANILGGQSDISKLNARDALTLLANVVRFQLSDKGSNNYLIAKEIEPAIEILKTREHLRLNIFQLISADEYFLSGYGKQNYYCGMVSWIGVHAFDVFKQHIPSLNNVYMFECGLQGPAHSFNLILTVGTNNIGIYLLDFQKEKFWNHDLIISKSSDQLLAELDMSTDVELTRLGH
jgi:hypothetical protein